MTQKKIMQVVEIAEKLTAQRIGDSSSCDISCEELSSLSGIPTDKMDIQKICLYLMNEIVTVTEKDDKETRYSLFNEVGYEDGVIKVSINDAVRGYFRMLVQGERIHEE